MTAPQSVIAAIARGDIDTAQRAFKIAADKTSVGEVARAVSEASPPPAGTIVVGPALLVWANPFREDYGCVVDAVDFTVDDRPHVPVGRSATTGSQVFACADQCAATLCIVCGPGCCAPVLGVHTSCSGPLVGRTVASVR